MLSKDRFQSPWQLGALSSTQLSNMKSSGLLQSTSTFERFFMSPVI